MKERILNQNAGLTFLGLIVCYLIYSNVYDDPSMSGWYVFIAFGPIIILPAVNYLLLSWYYDNTSRQLSIIAWLVVPLITVMSFLIVQEFIVVFWSLTLLIANLFTVRTIKFIKSS